MTTILPKKHMPPFMTLLQINWQTGFSRFEARASNQVMLFALCILILFSHTLAQAASPDVQWEKIETPHFSIIFDSKHRWLGELYARSSEQAFESTAPTFGIWPDKTVILLDDSTDLANGSATGIPYPLITSFPVLPNSLDTISDYGNWALELITHEYTHVLNFEPATGFMKPLRYLLGSIVRPNILLPRWYSEGLAVEMETRHSHYGRLRSPNFTSIVRALVADDSLRREDISRINEVNIPDWPGGARPYLLGALLMDELVRQKGASIIGDLNLAFSRRVPFFINTPIEDRFGIGWSKLLTKTYERAEKMAAQQFVTIKSAVQPVEQELDQPGFFSHSPVLSPDGKHIAFIGRVHNVDSLVYVIERNSEGTFSFSDKMSARTTGSAINRVSWMRDSKSFVHDGIETFDRYFEYSDIWTFDLEAKKGKRLTKGLRAREPVVSPDGEWIVFVQMTPGSTRLAAVRKDGSDLTILAEPILQTRISRPEFISKTGLVYTEKLGDGREVLKVAQFETVNNKFSILGEPQTQLGSFQPIHYPRMTSEGLLFVSDKSGVPNLYLATQDLSTANAVTNTSTRILSGDIDNQNGDLYYSKLLSYGPQIHVSKKEAWSKASPQPPQVEPFVDQDWPKFTTPNIDIPLKSEPYSPWWYLIPRYWMPYAYVAPGVSYFSASTSAADPTGRHSYAVQAAYDTLANGVGVFGTYTNRTTRVPVSFTALNSYDYISGGIQRQTSEMSVLSSFFIPKLSNQYKGALGWNQSATKVLNQTLSKAGPTIQVAYSNVKQRGLEISPEKGQSISMEYRRFLSGPSDFEYDVTELRAAKFLSGAVLPERHAIALFLNASIAPRLGSSVFGTSTLSGNYQTLPGVRGLVMRGYNPGIFVGRNLWSGTLEYRFPLNYTYRGYRSAPFFMQRWHANFFVDALTLDGIVYDYSTNRYNSEKVGRFFYGTGFEAKLDTTVFYHLPLQFIFGLYYGADERSNPYGLFPVISLGI